MSENIENLYKKGNKLLDINNFNDAKKCFEEAIAEDAYQEKLWNALGFTYQRLKDYNKAIECYDKAISLDPSSNASNNKGLVLSLMGNYEAALVCFDMLIRFRPSYMEAYQNKGMILQNFTEIRNVRSSNCMF